MYDLLNFTWLPIQITGPSYPEGHDYTCQENEYCPEDCDDCPLSTGDHYF